MAPAPPRQPLGPRLPAPALPRSRARARVTGSTRPLGVCGPWSMPRTRGMRMDGLWRGPGPVPSAQCAWPRSATVWRPQQDPAFRGVITPVREMLGPECRVHLHDGLRGMYPWVDPQVWVASDGGNSVGIGGGSCPSLGTFRLSEATNLRGAEGGQLGGSDSAEIGDSLAWRRMAPRRSSRTVVFWGRPTREATQETGAPKLTQLLDWLENPEAIIRSAAARALGDLGEDSVLEPLRRGVLPGSPLPGGRRHGQRPRRIERQMAR
jgi:hypothetical protein